MRNPLASICVPTYNRAALLRESLESICRQDYAPLEILIADNASTDGTEALCQELQAKDRRIRYIRHPHNIGLYANHNVCIEESRGALLGFFHDDDRYEPTIVSEYVAFFERHPEAGLVCSDWDLIDDDGHPIGWREFRVPPVMPGWRYIDRTLRSGRSLLGCPGTMVRRAAIGGVRFDEAGPIGFGDFVVWCTIAERTAVGHLAKRLWSYRIHRGSSSRRTIVSTMQDYCIALTRYCEDHLRRWPSHQTLVSRWQASIDRFLFWALVYELGRHFSLQNGHGPAQTIFDSMGYRLDADELRETLTRLKAHEQGIVKPAVRWCVERMVWSGHAGSLRCFAVWAPWLREALIR